MSIQTELTRLEGLRNDIGAAIRERGGTVPQGAKLADMPEGVRSIAGGGGKRTARFVIGTSTAGWTAADCDYLCDGTDDQVEINAAIQALPEGGGEVRILDGTYNITAAILVDKANTKLSGNGTATVLKRQWQPVRHDYGGVINLKADFLSLSSLTVDGNKAAYTVGNGVLIDPTRTGTTIKNILAVNNAGFGIYVYEARACTITENTCSNNNIGISVNTMIDTDMWDIIVGNVCRDNDIGIGVARVEGCTITGNICVRGIGQPSDYTSEQYTIRIAANKQCVVGNICSGKAPEVSGTGNIVANNVEVT